MPCATCDGSGAEPGTTPVTCPTCGGAGRVQQVSNTVFGQFIRAQRLRPLRRRRPDRRAPCKTCEGAGRTIEEKTLPVDIPAGIHDGQRIRLGGEGHAGEPGGRAGDLYVSSTSGRTRASSARATTLISTVDLTMTQAALGDDA